MNEGVDHHLDEVVVALNLVQNGGKDDERIGVANLGQLPAGLFDVVLAQTFEGVTNLDAGLDLGLDDRQRLGSWRGSRRALLQPSEARGSIQSVSDLVGQLGQN